MPESLELDLCLNIRCVLGCCDALNVVVTQCFRARSGVKVQLCSSCALITLVIAGCIVA